MFRTLINITEKPISTIVGSIENILCRDHNMTHAPTFIIGPPRSGTTLLGQVISHSFDVSYIPNLAIRFRYTYNNRPPIVTATRIAKLLGYTNNTHEKFQSYYGSSTLLGGSSDSDFIWRNIIPMGYLEKGDLTANQQRYIHRITAGIENIFNKPFIDKCVGHSLRIPALLEIFPNALFIRCRRNPLAVAQSVYFGRTRDESTRNTWLTPHATGYEELFKKDLIEQCAGQQYLFEQDIDRGLKGLDGNRLIDVDYDDICTQPKNEMDRINTFLKHNNITLEKINEPPLNFPHSNFRRLEQNIYNELVQYLERIYAKPVSHLLEPKI